MRPDRPICPPSGGFVNPRLGEAAVRVARRHRLNDTRRVSSRARYFAWLGRWPAAINFALNGAIGLLLFGARERVPWTGEGSVGADLLVGGFIVAAITAFALAPRVRRDAEGGLVAGRAEARAWQLLPGGRLGGAVVVALLVAFGMLVVLVPAAQPLAPDGLVGPAAALFKGVTSALAGQLAILLIGNRALVGAPDRVDAYDAARARPGEGTPVPPLGKACLAGTSRAHGTTVAPTWTLTLEGEVGDDAIRRAFERVADAFPGSRATIRPVDALATHARRFVWQEHDACFPITFVDGPVDAVRSELLNHHIDLTEAPPVRVVVVGAAPRREVFVQQHHGLADGRAFIDFLKAFGAALEDVVQGRPSQLERRVALPETAAFDRRPGQLALATARGARRYLREQAERRRRPLPPLPWNTKTAAPRTDGTIHLDRDFAELEALRPLRKRWGVGLNALLSAAWMRAIDGPPERLACELAAETRPRGGEFRSFANHLSMLFVTLEAAELDSLETAARRVQELSRVQVDDDAVAERALFRSWAVDVLPMDALRPRVLDDAEMQTQLAFSNLIALPFGPLAGDGWRVSRVRVTTPTLPPHGVLLTAVRYADTVTFNFNFDDTLVDAATVAGLAERFGAELDAAAVAGLASS